MVDTRPCPGPARAPGRVPGRGPCPARTDGSGRNRRPGEPN